jgi:hypothetical protein
MAQGRTEGRTVRAYLERLRAGTSQRDRKSRIGRRIPAIDDELSTADVLRELKLVQERRDLTPEPASMVTPVYIGALEEQEQFVAVAKTYSERQHISYASGRYVGVTAALLSRAGTTRRN